MFNSAPLALKNKAEFLEISFFAILAMALRLSALAKGRGVSWARLVGLRAICIHYFDEKLLAGSFAWIAAFYGKFALYWGACGESGRVFEAMLGSPQRARVCANVRPPRSFFGGFSVRFSAGVARSAILSF